MKPQDEPEQDWAVIFKMESFGRAHIRAKGKAAACKAFLKLSQAKVLKACKVNRPVVMGVLKQRSKGAED